MLGILSFAGVSEGNLTKAWWLALLVGLGFTVFTALTGLIDWLSITWRSPLWWTATWHMLSMLTATGLFALAAAFGHDRYVRGEMGSWTFVATLLGFVALTVGGWLGGAVVFTHGMPTSKLTRVLVEGFSKIIPSDLPSRCLCSTRSRCRAFRRSARSRTWTSSSASQSFTRRKSRPLSCAEITLASYAFALLDKITLRFYLL